MVLETPLAEAVRRVVLPWKGTATELLKLLSGAVDEGVRRQKGWPSSGRMLSNALRRLAPNLRQAGVLVEFADPFGKPLREPGTGRRLITISSENESNSSSQASQSSHESQAQPTQNPLDSERPGDRDECDDEIPSFWVEGEL